MHWVVHNTTSQKECTASFSQAFLAKASTTSSSINLGGPDFNMSMQNVAQQAITKLNCTYFELAQA